MGGGDDCSGNPEASAMIARFDNVLMKRPATTVRSPSTTFARMFAPLREMIEIMDRAGAAAHPVRGVERPVG
jgi:hypothetical protein